jgi:plastocyanin
LAVDWVAVAMPSSRALPSIILAVMALALAGCGSDDSTSSDEAATDEGGATATQPSPSKANAPSAGANAPAPSGDAVRSAKVSIVEFTYDPDPVTIEEGGKVIWMNEDAAPHTATADDGSFDTGTIEQGKLKSESFKQPGTYAYFCEIHPDMHGTVEVVPSG